MSVPVTSLVLTISALPFSDAYRTGVRASAEMATALVAELKAKETRPTPVELWIVFALYANPHSRKAIELLIKKKIATYVLSSCL